MPIAHKHAEKMLQVAGHYGKALQNHGEAPAPVYHNGYDQEDLSVHSPRAVCSASSSVKAFIDHTHRGILIGPARITPPAWSQSLWCWGTWNCHSWLVGTGNGRAAWEDGWEVSHEVKTSTCTAAQLV